MAVYHQMGYQSENLLREEHLGAYRGAILSPVNDDEARMARQIEEFGERQGFEIIFDPQLYFPNTQRACLTSWSYFPRDVDTADIASDNWWAELIESLGEATERLRPTAVCSPAIVPRAYTNDYFAKLVQVQGALRQRLGGTNIDTLQSAVVSLAELSTPRRAIEIGTILSRTAGERVYLILIGRTDPRREHTDTEELKGAMKLISVLEAAELQVLLGFCSSDIVLWKAAGASDCATGKFFNLRRFTPSRFEEPSEGGGVVPYWLEEALVGFLRDSDLVRVEPRGILSPASLANPYGQQIMAQREAEPGRAWVGLGWRQFMYWFADIDQRIEAGAVDVGDLLRDAERRWLDLADADVLMEEPRNDGLWIRSWRRALAEYADH